MKHLEGKTRSTKYATFCTPESIHVQSIICMLIRAYFSVVDCKLLGEKNFECCLKLCFSHV